MPNHHYPQCSFTPKTMCLPHHSSRFAWFSIIQSTINQMKPHLKNFARIQLKEKDPLCTPKHILNAYSLTKQTILVDFNWSVITVQKEVQMTNLNSWRFLPKQWHQTDVTITATQLLIG